MVTLLNGVAVAKRLDDKVIHVLIKPQPRQNGRELLFENFFPDKTLRAFPVIPRAMIIDVFALLDLGGQRATAVPTRDQAGECEILDASACLGVADIVPAVENVLSALPQVEADQRLMAALVNLAQPFEVARIETTTQDFMHGADRNRTSALAIDKSGAPRHGADFLQGIVACSIPLEHAGDGWPLVGINHNDFLAVRLYAVPVSERRGARPKALLCLFQHPLADLFGEIVDVVLRHQHFDAVHEFFRRSGFPGQDNALLHEVDLGIQFVDRHPILEIAVEPVSLLDQNGVNHLALSQEPDHLVEAGPATLLGRFDIDIFTSHDEPIGDGVFAQQLELGRNRKALALLLARRNPGVDDRLGRLHVFALRPCFRPRRCHVDISFQLQAPRTRHSRGHCSCDAQG
nr:hypothetical protein [Sphingobium fluviale]